MTYSSIDNNQNQTETNSYRIVDRLNYAALAPNYQPHQIEEFKASVTGTLNWFFGRFKMAPVDVYSFHKF